MILSPRDARFTVIIPTKDRAEYVRHTLRTCSLQQDDNLEIVVSDDGSRDHTRAVVEEAARQDPRIRYVSPGAGVGMRDNFEFALDQAKPGYVLALGGDDGLMPYGIRGMRELLAETGQEMACWPPPAFFYAGTKMPTAQLILHTAGPGRLQRGRRIVSSREFLARQARELSYVSDVESPMFYVKGVTSTRLVEKVRSRTPGGRFYACSTPDGYSGIVLAGEVETYAWSGTPFSLHGVSPTSAGVGYLAKSEEAKRMSAAFFQKAAGIPLHAELGGAPYSPLISVMTADYLLTARDLPGWPGSFPSISIRGLLDRSLAELADGLFAEDRIARELGILDLIAEHHGLGEYFRRKVKSSRRNARTTLEGNAISPSRLYLDGTALGLQNVFDAAYAAYHLHHAWPMLSLRTAWNALARSLAYRLKARPTGNRFPAETEWRAEHPEVQER